MLGFLFPLISFTYELVPGAGVEDRCYSWRVWGKMGREAAIFWGPSEVAN